ncbi:MAG: ABC transporter substrate-binding protein [bacterium]|nr:ABC transporter substrate-binding protein [bacterium]
MDKQRQLDDFFGIPSPEDGDKNRSSVKKPHSFKEVFNNKHRNLLTKILLLPKVLSNKERYLILIFLVVILGSIIAIPITAYFHFTTPIAANGGSISEGVVGEPRHINPLLSQTDADRDLVKLIYSGLFKYNEDGKLVPDLAKSYEVSPDELNYTVFLRENIKWHDGESLTVDDIIFTIQTAQNTDYGSLQRINWQSVELEKADEQTIIFKLKNKYAQFLNNLTLPIIPKHLWENIRPINFALSELNLKPIGSGPYEFKKLQKDSSGRIRLYELVANDNFYSQRPFIDKIQLKFYESEDALVEAFNRSEFNNLSFVSSKNLNKIKFKQRLEIEKTKMPRYFGIFFNQNQSKTLSDKNVRLALAYSTNKEALIQNVLNSNGVAIDSPLLGIVFSVQETNQEIKKYDYNKELAKEILNKNGWNKTDEIGILMNKEEKLTIKLTTSTWPELAEVARQIKDQWKEIGVDVQIEMLSTPELQQVIKERNYQMLLFGEILNLDPDPFSLWHSSQKRDPGLNLALYDNKSADTLLEDARKTIDPTERMKKYEEFQKLVIEDIPAIFLYSPYYLYAHPKKLKGFENKIIATPSDRLLNIEKWYVETRRVWR